MRRFVFYLGIAFLTFGIGSFVVINLFWKIGVVSENSEKSVVLTEKQKEEILNFDSKSIDKQIDISNYNLTLKEPTCTDKNVLSVWNELLNDEEFQKSAKRFYHEADCSVMLHIQKSDLNDDGQKEIILSGNNSNLCDAAFSCLYWIFEKKGNKYRQILRSTATGYNEIANYTIKRGIEISKTKSNSYRTVILRGGPGYQTFQNTFQFEKNKYKEKECLTFDYILNNKPWIRTCKEAGKE